MVKEIYIFKEKIEELLNDRDDVKIWVCIKKNTRWDFWFKMGEEQFLPAEKLAERGNLGLFAENLEGNLKNDLLEIFMALPEIEYTKAE